MISKAEVFVRFTFDGFRTQEIFDGFCGGGGFFH